MKIEFHFQNIYNTIDIYCVLTHDNQTELGNVISTLFDLSGNIIKQNK